MKKVLTLLFLTIFVFTLSACGNSYPDYPDAVYTDKKNNEQSIIFNNNVELLDSDFADNYWYPLNTKGRDGNANMNTNVHTQLEKELGNYEFALVTADIILETGGIDGRHNITIKKIKKIEDINMDEVKAAKVEIAREFDLEHPFVPYLSFYDDSYIVVCQTETSEESTTNSYVILEQNKEGIKKIEHFLNLDDVVNYFKSLE